MSHDDPAPRTEPEYLGDAATAATGATRSRRVPLLALASLGVVGVVAAGAWAALSLMSTGEQAATAVPADAVAYVSLDLDPAAEQKLEAVRIVEKFPALDEELGLDVQDDLRRWAFEEIRGDACADLDYDEDVAPWIGDRVAVAVLPPEEPDGDPVPMVALQVTDQDAASAGLDAVAACAEKNVDEREGDDVAFAFTGDYVVLAETQAVADGLVQDAAERALADEPAFTRWTEAAGDPGIVSVYVASAAAGLMGDLTDELSGGMPGTMGGMPGLFGGHGSDGQLEKMAADFEGLAGVVRFRDGAVEAEMVAGGLPSGFAGAGDAVAGLSDLPASTGAAFGFAVPEGWLQEYLEMMGELGGLPLEQMLAEGEAATGLELPEDIETLLGESVSLVVDSELDAEAVIASADPSTVPAGARVVGDPAEILPVVDKIKAAVGPDADMLHVREGDGAVAFGVSPDYVATLAGDGGLGDVASFRDVVPEADRATGVLYVDFAAGDSWVQRLVQELSRVMGGEAEPEVEANMAALDALGVSSWVDGDVQRGLFRLTTRP